MDKNKNYYLILGLANTATDKEIKKNYRKLSFKYHPDINKTENSYKFNEITEAYDILSNDRCKSEYDLTSKYGKDYNEFFEYVDLFSFSKKEDILEKDIEKIKKYEKNIDINNIYIEIDNEFNGYLEYERWVRCKKCDGHGKNFDKKIIIKNLEGKIIKIYQGGDGCDFCEGTGQNKDGDLCGVCGGHGKIGLSECVICHGNKRILGKQKLNNIKITGQKTKIDAMGHYSIDGKIGHLFLILKNK
jgi:molecular chaperone DnaJ